MRDFVLEQLSDGVLFLVGAGVLLLVVDLVHYSLLVFHGCHLGVRLLQSVHQSVNSLVKLVQVHFHVFFLGLEVLWFLVRVELIEWHVFSAIILVVDGGGARILLFVFNFIFISLRVSILLKHESLSSLQRSSLNIFGRLWEQVAKLKELGLGDAHEDDVWHRLSGATSIIVVVWGEGLEYNV